MKKNYLIGVCKAKPKMIGNLLVPIGLLTTLVGWFVGNITDSWITPEKFAEMCAEENKNNKDSDSEK